MAASAAAFLIGLQDAPIERAEIYFLDAARAMVERADWLVPFYRGEPFYDKPPLTYWLLAASFQVFGPSLFAGRLVAAVLALVTLWATFLLTRRLVPSSDGEGRPDAPLFAAVILGTSYAFVSFARLTMSDMLLTFLTLAAGGLYLRAETEARPTLLVVCGTVLGLGFLAKGPIAWVYFLALLAAVAAVERRLPRIFNFSGLVGTLAATVCGLSWFLFVYLREGIEPLKWFFLRENLQRFAAPTYDAAEPFWFYLPVYAVEGLPWSILLIPAIRFAFQTEAPKVLRTLLVWSLFMLVPLSLSRGKIDYYLLPILPLLSVVIGAYLARGRPSSKALRTLALSAALLFLGAAAFPMLPPPFAPGPRLVWVLRGFLGAVAVASLLSAIRPVARHVVFVCAIAMLGTSLFLFGALVPAYRSAQPTDEFLADIARERIFTPDLEIAVCDDSLRLQRDILFTLRVPVIEQCELWALVSSSRKFLLIVTPDQEASLRTAQNVRHIATRDHLPADISRLATLLDGAEASKVGLIANFATSDPVARWKANREWKRLMDTPEGRKAQAEYEERQRRLQEERERSDRR